MKLDTTNITTQGQARDFAIEWQRWAGEQDLSYGELAEWGAVLGELAEKYDLQEEFNENGIL